MDGSERDISRRALLGGLAAGTAGLAGCSTKAFMSDDSTPGTDGGTGESSPTATGTPTPAAGGQNIPSYPYRNHEGAPLAAEPDPESLSPAMQASYVTDAEANFVADPFLFVTEDDDWHMFFEVATDSGGVISHATSDDRGRTWAYDQVVLQRPYHLSFPYVFKWQGEYYMTTEEGRNNAKPRLYRAEEFPKKWTHETDLYDPTEYGHDITDHVLFRWEGKWWDLAGIGNSGLRAYYSDSLTGEYEPHENNPIVTDRKKAARPAGRPIVREDDILMFYQDSVEFYGEKVRAYSISDLSPSSFQDSEVPESPVIDGSGENGRDWNEVRMHHYDPWYLGDGEGWRCAVDGNGRGEQSWSIGIYHVPPEGESSGGSKGTASTTPGGNESGNTTQ